MHSSSLYGQIFVMDHPFLNNKGLRMRYRVHDTLLLWVLVNYVHNYICTLPRTLTL